MSAWLDSYYSVTFNARGHKFIGAADTAGSTPIELILIESDLAVNAQKIAFGAASLSAQASSVFVARKLVFAQSSLFAGSVVLVADVVIAQSPVFISISSEATAAGLKQSFAKIDASGSVGLLAKATSERFISPVITSSASVSVVASEILFSQVSVSIESSLAVDADRVSLAKAQIDIIGYKLTIAQEILLAKINIAGSASVGVVSSKIAFLKSDLEAEASVAVSALGITVASINAIVVGSEASAEVLKILLAQSTITGLAVKVTVGQKYSNARFNGKIISRVLKIPAIRFSPSLVEDTQHIRPLLIIAGKPLTEHNRKVDISILEQFTENQNWQSTKSRYYKKKKARKSFTVSWTFVPNSREKTVDQKHGRDTIREIGRNPKVLSMKLLEIDSSGLTPYTEISHDIVVTAYQESLVRRDVSDNSFYWDCNLTFEEV